MSYEGFEEYLCKKGHYYTGDAFDNAPDCPYCSSAPAHYHAVDCTNGIEEGCPGTTMGEKIPNGHWDMPQVDVLGNKYVKRINIWLPTNHWRKIPAYKKDKVE